MRIYQVDAFTDTPFRGNPAGVCFLDEARSDDWMRGVAAEMNLSETAFLLETGDRYSLRWLTPTTEVSLCGHATLASAHVLWETGALDGSAGAVFDTRSGKLTARRDGAWVEMDFPIRRVEPAQSAPPEVCRALGAAPVEAWLRRSHNGEPSHLLVLATEAEVRGLHPDFAALRATGARSVIVTSRSVTAGYDFVSRFFGPALGIDEDPVTGSAHCCLAPYWAPRLGKTELLGLQVSVRGGVVGCSPRGERVLLRGQAVTTLRGEVLV